jgi:hypothetical protein
MAAMQVMQEQLPAHALVADGVFPPSGAFRLLPPLPKLLQNRFSYG